MKSRMLTVDETMKILPEQDMKDFPMSICEQPVCRKGYGNVMHWHGEAQFSLVTKGAVLFRTAEEEYCAQEGEAVFFNCNCIHEAVPVSREGDAVYLCIKFSPDLIYGQAESRIRSRYFEPILYSEQLQSVPLQQEKWQREICRLLKELATAYEQEAIGFELRVSIRLMEIWLLLYQNLCPTLVETVSVSYLEKQRLGVLHNFIRENYGEKITLDDIANAAHVSRGECCRIFRRLHHTTPFQYLIHFRLSQSIQLLSDTSCSISQIAQQVGFGSSSYYTECFKKEMHCTPHKYRQRLHHISNSMDIGQFWLKEA